MATFLLVTLSGIVLENGPSLSPESDLADGMYFGVAVTAWTLVSQRFTQISFASVTTGSVAVFLIVFGLASLVPSASSAAPDTPLKYAAGIAVTALIVGLVLLFGSKRATDAR